MTAVFGYIAGVALGANIGYQASISNKIWPYTTTKVLAAEFLMIILFASAGIIAGNSSSNVVYVLILLASISMGMQSAAVRSLGVSGVTTTYVAGTWTSFIIGLMGLRRSHPSQRTIKDNKNTIIQAITLVAYIAGAATGGLVEPHFLFQTALIPSSIIGCVLIVAWIRFSHIS
jgi:uncharacterized membrane protein YoaK (UPF0700 family)